MQALAEAEAQAAALKDAPAALRLSLLSTRAVVSSLSGDFDTGARKYEQLRREYRLLGNLDGESSVANNLAELEHARGNTERAIMLTRESLPRLRQGIDELSLAITLTNLTGYLVAADDLVGASAAAREALALLVKGDPDHGEVAILVEHLALVHALDEDFTRAAKLEGYAEAAFQRYEMLRESTERGTRDRLNALLCAQLTPDDLARLTVEGATLSPDEAIAEALR